MSDKNLFYNRELSWLEFDKRCLSEAKDKNIPIFERIKFLSITASNLDEFFYGAYRILKGYEECGIYEEGYRRNDTGRTA